ncbi:MAG: hypothetical protein EXR33_11180 [Betaproteobacteria bacterium]|nr:hypothetical protein [Betaproteobacteria bacterium]
MKRLVLAALMLGAALAAGQGNPRKSDSEREYEMRGRSEPGVALPAPPAGELIEFFVSSASSFRFFIDPQSVSLGADGAVRYTLVARSRSGAENVSYEGMRCDGSYRVFAIGNDGGWSVIRQSEWRRIEPRSVQRWHNELYLRYFCVDGIIIRSPEEGLNALRRGGRPDFNNSERAN